MGAAMTVQEALSAAGINLRNYAHRTHRTACPRCAKGPRDTALAVTVHNDDDVVWNCHRCHWADGWRANSRKLPPTIQRDRGKQACAAKSGEAISLPKRRTISDHILDRRLRRVSADSPAGQYFTARSCALPSNDVWFTPAEWHPHERRCFPCIVAIITDIITAEPISLHFTFLDPDGDGKAKIDKPRLYLTGHRKAGGIVRLHADDEVEQGVIIGEGIETCLSYALEFSPVWSCLDAGNLAAFPVLPGIEGLTVLIDNDDAGRDAFEVVRERYEAAGIEVIGIRADGKPGADINDMVTA
jgi:hypothetical protein